MSLGKKSHFRTFKLQKCVGGSSEHCCVPRCSASSRYNTSLSFHCFPKDASLRSEWLVQIKREHFTITKHTKVCSRHFKADEVKVTVKGKRVLKSNVVPSLFEWNNYGSQRAERLTDEHEEEEEEVADQAEARAVPTVTDHSYGACSTICVDREHYENMVRELEESRQKMESVQLQSSFGIQRFSASPEDIQHYTRFASYEHLMSFWNLIESATTKMVRVTAHKSSTSTETPLTRPTKLKPIDELFLFLTYLSTGCGQIELGHRFGVPVSAVSAIVVAWADLLYCLLGSVGAWTSPAAIRATLPQDFRGYEDTQVVDDCARLLCQAPSSLLLPNEALCSFRPRCAFRAVVGVSPLGALTFVSSLFEGRATDRELVRRSGVGALLSRDAAVMVGEGFRVDDAVPGSVHRPACLSRGAQREADDVLKTQTSARLRVHVERAMRRVKENKLFDGVIPLSISGSIRQIFTVACLLSNYQHGPVVSKWNL